MVADEPGSMHSDNVQVAGSTRLCKKCPVRPRLRIGRELGLCCTDATRRSANRGYVAFDRGLPFLALYVVRATPAASQDRGARP
jgi:hypothetical protein